MKGIKKMTINVNKSHIMYNTYTNNPNEENKTPLCNYLIKIEQSEDFEEIIPCNTISKVLEICALEKRWCRVYERSGTMGKNWHYLVDISRGVI